MVSRLTQLGMARLVPLVTARTEPQARDLSSGRRQRLLRTARESLKQCGRLWMPDIAPASRLTDSLAGPGMRVVLAPGAKCGILSRLEQSGATGAWTEACPLVLILGPEGGFDESEQASIASSDATAVCLGAHVLRIETAAEAALAVASQWWLSRAGTLSDRS